MKAWRCFFLALALAGAQLVTPGMLAAEPIRVGVTAGLSGTYTAPSADLLEGLKMWAYDVNARGALLGREVEIVSYDDQSDPATSARLYEKLINDDQVDLLIGPYASDVTLAASEVAERHGFPMVSPSASATDIWSRGYKNIFQVDSPALQQQPHLIQTEQTGRQLQLFSTRVNGGLVGVLQDAVVDVQVIPRVTGSGVRCEGDRERL